eukprot:6525563-Alexandrium_andersonii.AAC.1
MSASLVGSEMCIRDSPLPNKGPEEQRTQLAVTPERVGIVKRRGAEGMGQNDGQHRARRSGRVKAVLTR